MKILMTGATGLLGLNTVPQLLEAGHEVVEVVRKPDAARELLGDQAGLSFVQGDLGRIEDMVPHLAGCDAVVHAAALFTEYYATGAEWDRFYELNVLGTQTLFRAARAAGLVAGCLSRRWGSSRRRMAGGFRRKACRTFTVGARLRRKSSWRVTKSCAIGL
jgi:nucleoside-diphosphate-sugar epimerase